ncbi:MAG: DegT/DnrJ/EryC1/StrS aminotransferase family protein [Bacteroidales bacterium]|nr:DegT/DnrJ/EryC1/StrS aminotransferase family protein [Bacteroidales bacterium]
MMIPFSPPRIDDKIIAEVVDTLKSGWITTGPKTKLFEKKLAEYTGAKACLCLNSATAGLELILRWFGVGKGDEVIIPAYTYCATANVVIHCGATPVMLDVEKDSFNIDPQKLKLAITTKTKVIIPVDIAGLPCNYDEIYNIINAPAIKQFFNPENDIQAQLGRILIMADAAHSLGAKYKNNNSGTLADISVFSFHAVKNLTTAEGGAVALNLPKEFDNNELYKFLCVLGLHGQNKDALAKTNGNWRYDVITAGYKVNMTDIQASMGLVELARYNDDTLVKRRYIFDIYSNAFNHDERYSLPLYETTDSISSYHVYLLRIKDITESQRDEIITRINEKGVSVNVHFQPLPLLTFYKSLGYDIKDYPQAFDNYKCEISLPVFYDLTNEQLQTITNAVKTSVEEVIG